MKTFLVYLSLILMVLNSEGQNQTINNERTLHVKGTAIFKQIPEVISVAMFLKTEAKEYGNCQDKLLMNLQKAKTNFINKGIDKSLIKTNDLQLSENKTYNRNGEEIKSGFIGSASILIESTYSAEFTKNLYSALKSDSVIFNYAISFKLSESQKEVLRKSAVSKALEDAKEKATQMAESANVRLEAIKSIIFNDDYFPRAATDGDIVREFIRRPGIGFVNFDKGTDDISSNARNTPITDFNPREVKIVKAVDVVWSIIDNDQKTK